MKAELIRQRFVQDLNDFTVGDINATCFYMRGVKIGEESAIDKALEQYEKELRQMKNILNTVKDGAGKLISIGGSLIQFKKALEEDEK